MTNLWALPLALVVAAAALYGSAWVRCCDAKHKESKRMGRKTCVFLAGLLLWPALFVVITRSFSTESPAVLMTYLIVLGYIGFELQAPFGYAGALEALDGTPEAFFERGTQVTTVAFALGTLLVSQKDAALARNVAPIVFLALFFAAVPSLAVGQTARRNFTLNPTVGAVQRIMLSFAAGLLCLALASCMDYIRKSGGMEVVALGQAALS